MQNSPPVVTSRVQGGVQGKDEPHLWWPLNIPSY